MNRLYIFGLGSPYGWDQVGWLAADQLRQTFSGQPAIVVDMLSRPTNLFSHPITPMDWVIFIDSMMGKARPGTAQRFTTLALPPAHQKFSSHGIDLNTTIALLASLGFSTEKIQIVAVEIPADTEPSPEQTFRRRQALATQSLHAEVKSCVEYWLQFGVYRFSTTHELSFRQNTHVESPPAGSF